MTTYYDDSVKGHVTTDDSGNVRHIRHSQELPISDDNIPVEAASAYLRDMAGVLGLDGGRLGNLHVPAQDEAPEDRDVDYRLEDEKTLFDATTVSFVQTFFDVPVFRRGISVKVKQGPNRVVGVANNTDPGLEGALPSEERIAFFRDLFRGGAGFLPQTGRDEGQAADVSATVTEAARVLRRILGLAEEDAPVRDDSTPATGLMNGRLVAYRYQPELRFAGRPEPSRGRGAAPAREDATATPEAGPPPFPDIPSVHESIEPGRTYLCAEMVFRHDLPQSGDLVWLMLVEVETDSILYIECQTCAVTGLVFRVDPNVGSGDLTVDASDDNAILEKHVSSEVLHDLDAPVAGTQHLRGTYVVVQDVEPPPVPPPTRPQGADFDFAPRTNDFAAVNAYYHQTQLFRRIADLGFPIASYFDATTFPTLVDHRGRIATADGIEINAHWSPNGVGGTGHQCYALCDLTNTAQPLGRAVDPWVHWHEMGGHGTLGDHVGSGTFGFAHSAGDGLAALQMDPESALRGTVDRFRYAPFRPSLVRRFDRTWLWGGPEDDQNYNSEQILATCHFRIYRSIGGDHPDVGRRRFASRVATYLILRAIGQLTPGTNPDNRDPATMTDVPGRGAQLWCEELQEADRENWISEGLSGGAYNKVIRWAFEKQGSYGGQPPAVDVYIDDGRAGEYPFRQVHWANQSMWNRNAPDGLPGHQNAVAGATNHFYVKVKNRGTSDSGAVTVRGYHCLPGAGLIWPNDFTAMSPAVGLPVPAVAAGSTAEVVVGPFEWVPNENVHGHDCVLMIASTDGDPSNVEHITGSESVQEWRLVPNDNNIGQRNVNIVPGGGGPEALVTSLRDAVFVAGNNLPRPARMRLRATLPSILADRGWSLDLDGGATRFQLPPGEKRTLQVGLVPGDPFTADDLRAADDRSIEIRLLADDMELGGVRYTVDPDLER
jgi:zinc metalloprotease ZmpB